MAMPHAESAPLAQRRTNSHSLANRERKWGLIFLSPWILGFLLFTAIPMAVSLLYSFASFDIIHPENLRYV